MGAVLLFPSPGLWGAEGEVAEDRRLVPGDVHGTHRLSVVSAGRGEEVPDSWEAGGEATDEVQPDGVLGHKDQLVEGDLSLALVVAPDDGGQEEVEEAEDNQEDHEYQENVSC